MVVRIALGPEPRPPASEVQRAKECLKNAGLSLSAYQEIDGRGVLLVIATNPGEVLDVLHRAGVAADSSDSHNPDPRD